MEQAAAQDLLLGAKVGNYEVREKLGEGGMGAVYLAVHPRIGKRVALKVLHPEFSSNEDVVGRFFNEAKAVNDIQHPNIVDIIDYGTMPSPSGNQPVVYFIMEFLGGQSLARIIHEQAPLSPERAQAIALQIADALGASHRQGIVHRDLKPDNVMISQRRDGRDFVKVLDFGIAKLTGDQQGSRRTRTGIVMGTPAYMSPEQCEGRGQIDHRTDIYALGILLYEMLTGQVPFRGEGYGEVLVQHMTQAPQKPSTIRGVVPPHLEAVCMKALEKRTEQRFDSMDEMMKALADPVAYVEAHGGVEGFHSYGGHGGAVPTPYPIGAQPPYGMVAGHAPPTPAPGYLGAVNPAYPTPPPGSVARAGGSGARLAIIAGLAVALGVGIFFIYKAATGKDEPAVAAAPAEDQGDKEPVASGGGEGGEGTQVAGTTDEPAEPEMVEIELTTRPPGAEVYVAGEATPRGTTPYKFQLPRSEDKVWLRLVAEGYEVRRAAIVPSKNIQLDWQLVARPEQPVADKDEDKAKKGKDGSREERASAERKERRERKERKDRKESKDGDSSRRKQPASAGDNTLRPSF